MEESPKVEGLAWLLAHYQAGLHRRLERWSKSPRWSLWVTLLAVALAFAASFPRYEAVQERASKPYGQALEWWLAHPLRNVPTERFFAGEDLLPGKNGGVSHCDKLAFRCVIPFIHQAAPFGLWTLVGACHVAGIAIFWLVYKLVTGTTGDRVSGALATWALAATFAGQWSFQDLAYGDAVAVGLLLAAMFARRPWIIFALMVLAGFTDERSIVASPLVALFHWLRPHPSAGNPTPGAEAQQRSLGRTGPVVGAVLCCLLLRWAITHWMGVLTGRTMLAQIAFLRLNFFDSYPLQIFAIFKGLWAAPAVLLLTHRARTRTLPWWVIAYVLAMGVVAAAAFMVLDLDRSLFYLLPGVVLAVCFWPLSPSTLRTYLTVCLVGAVLWTMPHDAVTRFVLMWQSPH